MEAIAADMKRELTIVKSALRTIPAHTNQQRESCKRSIQHQTVPKSYAGVTADGASSLPQSSLDSTRVSYPAETGENARRRKKSVKRKSVGAENNTK